MFPLAFGLVPEKYHDSVVEFIRSRRMACSVYGSQYLLDALYEAGAADYGLELMTATHDRSWYNMIKAGSTITLEAWDAKYKPNLDWNHAWGAAPANIIPRRLMGITPASPGFDTIQIKPQPGKLSSASYTQHTIKGAVKVAFQNEEDSFVLNVELPANTRTNVFLPKKAGKFEVFKNGEKVKVKNSGGFVELKGVESGQYTFEIVYL